MKDFKQFLLRGNLVDMAVGIVIGVAFAAVVTSFVANLVTPLIAALGGKPNFNSLAFTVNHSRFTYGAFINALISFVIIAAIVFFFVVKHVNALMARYKTETPLDTTVRPCPHCLSDIPSAATRCAFCTQPVEPVPVTAPAS